MSSALFVAVACVAPAAAISLGQSDDFEVDGALWFPASVIQVADGGPGGTGDGYLEYSSDGVARDGRMIVLNNDQWTGDYLAAGVSAVSLQANNLSGVAQSFDLRVAIGTGFIPSSFPASSGTWYASTVAVTLAPGSGWVPLVFDLDPASLTLVTGSAAANDVLADVQQLRILSSVAPNTRGDEFVGTLGLDDITAVPEPSVGLLLGLGLAGLGATRRRSLRAG